MNIFKYAVITAGTFILTWIMPRWFSWLRVRLETRRSWVRPPPRSATFFRGDWSWNIFYGHSLPSADSRRAVVIFWQILVNRLEDEAFPVNVLLGKLTTLDLTPLGWLGRKTSTQTNMDHFSVSWRNHEKELLWGAFNEYQQHMFSLRNKKKYNVNTFLLKKKQTK